ncbi:MAG: AP endonuclease, partial [Bacteroidia bacterium]|nr:AP endonuclease [Bacteroidia bacterium]
MKKNLSVLYIILLTILNYSCKTGNTELLVMDNFYPWCIVAYDSMERNPSERVAMLKKMNFSKYAYDWRDRHLESTAEELSLANENDIEIISVWLWLNAKRDSTNNL